uniref:Alba domain-containing protein n=1 Tax=Syphacia muris TaxID=451379 RepID=A0A0N5A8B1_9BILA
MEFYEKHEEISVENVLPFPKELTEGIAEINVREGTKFKNVLGFAGRKFQDPNCRRIIFKGVGEATAKCISCVEVFKRNCEDELYQWNAINFSRRSDVWVPNAGKEELSKLLVHVDVPTMFVLISKDPFPPEYANDSCQSAFQELTGFHFCNPKGNANSKSNQKKPQFKRTTEANKWKRTVKKRTSNQTTHSASNEKPEQ